ncbi:MAG: glycosyltransferase 87 family protein [Defluviitaleaceae bacterium]|nr:glycosyltransferase 87 family protein [Defluviitaleaceae bacterium]
MLHKIIVAAVALVARIITALLSNNRLDIAEYHRWAMSLQDGLTSAYNHMPYLDYPPLYIPVLYIKGAIINALSLSELQAFIVLKSATILVDVAACVLLYVIISKRASIKTALIASLAYALSPAILMNTAWWGQTDGQIMFFAILLCCLIEQKRWKTAAAICALAALTKMQGAFLLPILGLELLRTRSIKNIALSAATFITIFIMGLLPYARHTGGLFGIFSRIYLESAGKYPVASNRAFNFMALIGGSITPDYYTPIGSLTFFTIGITITAIATMAFAIYYFTRKNPDVWLGLAMIIYTIFMFMPRMHERYMIYIIPLLTIPAFCTYAGKLCHVLKGLLTIATVIIFINHAILMWGMLNQPTRSYWIEPFEQFVVVMSAVNFVLYIVTCVIYVKAQKRHEAAPLKSSFKH